MKRLRSALIFCSLLAFALAWVSQAAQRKPASVLVTIDTPMEPPEWARLERQLLDAHTPAVREFYQKYYDSRGYVQCVLRWGADDGPDDAFENMSGWPELHALGGSDDVLRLYMQGLDGMLRQYTEARTTQVFGQRRSMIPEPRSFRYRELQLFGRARTFVGVGNRSGVFMVSLGFTQCR